MTSWRIFTNALRPAVYPLHRVVPQAPLAFERLGHGLAEAVERCLEVGRGIGFLLVDVRLAHWLACSMREDIHLLFCTRRWRPDCSKIGSGCSPMFIKHCTRSTLCAKDIQQIVQAAWKATNNVGIGDTMTSVGNWLCHPKAGQLDMG
jgi:hypothetical protein